MKLQRLLLGLSVVFSTFAVAGPYYRQIDFTYHATKNNSRRNVCVQRILGQCVQWREEVNLRTRHGWNNRQKNNALAALRIVADRFLDPSVVSCALNNAKKEFHSGAPFSIPSYSDFRNFVWGQRNALFNNGFPHVNIQINDIPAGYAGQAALGNFVDARAAGGGHSVSGRYWFEMDVELMNNSNPLQIAGVMAHEMLHQMTHSHPNGYNDENFVVVYQNCLINNGRYSRPGIGLHGGGGGIQPIHSCGSSTANR